MLLQGAPRFRARRAQLGGQRREVSPARWSGEQGSCFVHPTKHNREPAGLCTSRGLQRHMPHTTSLFLVVVGVQHGDPDHAGKAQPRSI